MKEYPIESKNKVVLVKLEDKIRMKKMIKLLKNRVKYKINSTDELLTNLEIITGLIVSFTKAFDDEAKLKKWESDWSSNNNLRIYSFMH